MSLIAYHDRLARDGGRLYKGYFGENLNDWADSTQPSWGNPNRYVHNWAKKNLGTPDQSAQVKQINRESRQQSKEFDRMMKQYQAPVAAQAAPAYGGGTAYVAPTAAKQARVGVGGQATAV